MYIISSATNNSKTKKTGVLACSFGKYEQVSTLSIVLDKNSSQRCFGMLEWRKENL